MNFILLLFGLYIVIFLGVKHGINYSYVGQLAKNKFPNEIKAETVTDDEIEQELNKSK